MIIITEIALDALAPFEGKVKSVRLIKADKENKRLPSIKHLQKMFNIKFLLFFKNYFAL